MHFCRATSAAATLSWTASISPPLHISHSFPEKGHKKPRVWCLSSNGEFVSLNKESKMIVSVTGATGFIGKRLVQRLHDENHQICVLTRSTSKAQSIFPEKDFPAIVIAEEPQWKNCIEGSTAVVNLAGLPISTRWSAEIKKEIKDSSIKTTSKVLEGPRIWALNSNTVA